MARIVRCGLIQAQCEWSPEKFSLARIKGKMIAKHEKLIAAAAKSKVQILGLQELFYGPYFCAEQQNRWFELTEPVPSGPTLARMQKLAKKYQMVLVVPVYEVEMPGVYICYDRHFPEGARILGLNGAEIVFNPSATVAGLSEYLWELEQPAHAVA